jgi:outer membrane protein assembly factor BamB
MRSRQFIFLYKFNLIFAAFLLSATILRAQTADGKANSLQLKLCWRVAENNLTAVSPTAKNNRLFVPLNGGVLLALNAATGETLWRAELGGEIMSQPVAADNLVFAATRIVSADKAFFAVRALSSETGVVVWQGDLNGASRVDLTYVAGSDVLLAAVSGAENRLIALSANKGKLLWTYRANADFASDLIIYGSEIGFATVDGAFQKLNLADGAQLNKFLLPVVPNGKIISAENKLFLADATGNFFAVRGKDGKIVWKLRLGAAVSAIATTEKGVLIAALDDFIYFQRLENGKRIWKKRLPSRPLGLARLNEETILAIVSGETNAFPLTIKKGKIAGQIVLAEPAVAAPLVFNNFAFVQTQQNIFAFVSQNAAGCSVK